MNLIKKNTYIPNEKKFLPYIKPYVMLDFWNETVDMAKKLQIRGHAQFFALHLQHVRSAHILVGTYTWNDNHNSHFNNS